MVNLRHREGLHAEAILNRISRTAACRLSPGASHDLYSSCELSMLTGDLKELASNSFLGLRGPASPHIFLKPLRAKKFKFRPPSFQGLGDQNFPKGHLRFKGSQFSGSNSHREHLAQEDQLSNRVKGLGFVTDPILDFHQVMEGHQGNQNPKFHSFRSKVLKVSRMIKGFKFLNGLQGLKGLIFKVSTLVCAPIYHLLLVTVLGARHHMATTER